MDKSNYVADNAIGEQQGEIMKRMENKPMKPVIIWRETMRFFIRIRACRNCGDINMKVTDNYCRKCGQAIDWSEE